MLNIPFIAINGITNLQLTQALRVAVTDQMQYNRTTLIEAMLNQALGDPFRRDAMKTPVVVADIDAADMVKAC